MIFKFLTLSGTLHCAIRSHIHRMSHRTSATKLSATGNFVLVGSGTKARRFRALDSAGIHIFTAQRAEGLQMQFVAKDEENEVISLTLHSECPKDKLRIALLLAALKTEAGTAENSGSTGAQPWR